MAMLRERLESGERALGMALCYGCPGIVERIGKDWDWIWVDVQHGQFSYQDVVQVVRAIELVGSRAVVRPPGKSFEWLGMYADLLPAGMMIPMVNTVAEAVAVADALRFPPIGRRSFGSRRAGDLMGPKYASEFDLFVMAQIETVEAVGNAAGIIATAGIDCLFFGANDVRLDMGLALDVSERQSKELLAAMERTAQVARAAGKWAGCVANSEGTLRLAMEMGYTILACGADQLFLREGSAAALKMGRSVKPLEATVYPVAAGLVHRRPPLVDGQVGAAR